MGNDLKVSELIPYSNGAFPWNLTKFEKRNTSYLVPVWDIDKCIQCGQCNIVCPHGVIRPIVNKDGIGKDLLGNSEYKYYLAISEKDCTGCGLCIKSCPTNALSFGNGNIQNREVVDKYFESHENPKLVNKFTVKGASLEQARFKFHGACAGCGETSYTKLLTQLFGEELVIANATGCSSIYGGSVPSTPYSIPWANSLFEDNAEFALGIHMSYKQKRVRIKKIMELSLDSVREDVKVVFQECLDNFDDYKVTTKVKQELQN